MEKIKMDYLKFWLATLVTSSLIFITGIKLKINDFSQVPLFILITFGIVLYVYILDKFTQTGYSVTHTGIYADKKLTVWNEVSIQKDYFVWKILLQDRNIRIHFDKFHQKSIITLIKKYCPHDHELYKTIKEYAEKENIQF